MRNVYDDLSFSNRLSRKIRQTAHGDRILIFVLLFVTILIIFGTYYFLKAAVRGFFGMG